MFPCKTAQGEECKRQLAILFSFMDESQPTESIEVLLGEVDNGQVNNIVVTDPGGGYTGKVPKVGLYMVELLYVLYVREIFIFSCFLEVVLFFFPFF